MMKLRKIQDIGDGVVSSVKFFEIDKKVNSMKFRDAAVVDRENLQRGNFLTKHPVKDQHELLLQLKCYKLLKCDLHKLPPIIAGQMGQ